MENFGIHQKYIALVKMCNINTNFKVRFWQETSTQFKVQTGLHQGDTLSPMLFNIALEKVVRDMSNNRKMSLGDLNVLLAYADDIVIMGNSRDDIIQTTRKLLKTSKRMGLEVNQQKTKYMCMTRTDTDNSDLEVDNLTFEKFNQFTHLGVNMNSTNIIHNEIKNRLSSANKCYFSLLKLLKSKHLFYESKKILYTSYIRPILTYGCETWSTTKGNHQSLITFERKILRKIYGPLYNRETEQFERRHNNDLRELYGRPNILSYTRSKRLE